MAIAGWLLHLFNEEETKPSAQCTPTQRQQTIHQQPCVPIIIMLYISIYLVQAIQQTLIYSVRQNIPLRFLTFFPKPLGIFSLNFTRLLYVPIYAILQIFLSNYLQLWRSYAILSATTQRSFRLVVDIWGIWCELGGIISSKLQIIE